MSATSELLTTYLKAGAVGEAPQNLHLVLPLEGTGVISDLLPSSTQMQSIGSSALLELVPEFVEPDPAPAKGITKPYKTALGLAPVDEFGLRVYAFTDNINPDVLNDMERSDFEDHIRRTQARHAVNENRFFANTLPEGMIASVDARRTEFEDELRYAPSPEHILPNPTVPPITDVASFKRSLKNGIQKAANAIRSYREKPLLKDKQ
jgi:hypothetical protein